MAEWGAISDAAYAANDPNDPNDPNDSNDPNDPKDPNDPNDPNDSNGPSGRKESDSAVPVLVMDEIMDRAVGKLTQSEVGKFVGQVKWWNDKLGFGFATVCDGPETGRDIFVHHTGIRPLRSNYRTLRKGEYVNFNVTQGHNGQQAVDVTGICGGMLMCDVIACSRARV